MALAPRPTRAFRHVSSPAPTFASAPRPAGRAYPALPPPAPRARPAPRQPRAAAPQTLRDASARPPRAPQSFRVGGHGPAPAPPQGRWEPRRRHRGWERGDVRGCGGARSALWRSVERGGAGSVQGCGRSVCGAPRGACAARREGLRRHRLILLVRVGASRCWGEDSGATLSGGREGRREGAWQRGRAGGGRWSGKEPPGARRWRLRGVPRAGTVHGGGRAARPRSFGGRGL